MSSFDDRRRENFKIEIKPEHKFEDVEQDYGVSVTHNGYQWMTQKFTLDELKQLIEQVTAFVTKTEADIAHNATTRQQEAQND